MTYLALILMCLAFVEAVIGLRVTRHLAGIVAASRRATTVLCSADFDDDVKERTARAESLAIFRETAMFSVKFLLVIAGPALLGVAFVSLTDATAQGLTSAALSMGPLVGLTLLGCAYAKLRQMANSTSDYRVVDQLLHHVAFETPMFHRALASLDEDMHASTLKDTPLDRPVFVTALPRAGTTLVLELLHGTGEFASFTYRQMPLVTAPLLWQRVSGRFQRSGDKRERAHKDGIQIDFDSPEAFEEVFWLAHMKKRIVDRFTLNPVGADDLSAEFREGFGSLMRRLVALHGSDPAARRYLSKNNVNFSRVAALRSVCEDAVVVVPFRHPLEHIRSLASQHDRFEATHADDPFSKSYMKWIGHYDFGANFRPIDIRGRYRGLRARAEPDLDFWLEYWCDCYEYCLDELDGDVHLVDFDGLCKRSEASLAALADVVGLTSPDKLLAAASTVRQPGSKRVGADAVSAENLDRAFAIHERLEQRAINAHEDNVVDPAAREPQAGHPLSTRPQRRGHLRPSGDHDRGIREPRGSPRPYERSPRASPERCSGRSRGPREARKGRRSP